MASFARTADARVLIRDFAAGGFGPGDVLIEFENVKNVGWGRYANKVNEAFFTVTQGDPKLVPLRALVDNMPYVDILRNNKLMFRGYVGEIDETETDVVFYAYSLESMLFVSHTDFDESWSGETVGQIVEDAIDQVIAKPSGRLSWISKGTIEAPPTTSGGSTAITLPEYEAPFKRHLFLFQEMVSISSSDTTNRTRFEITPEGVFNFFKNDGTTQSSLLWEYGGGAIAGYRRVRLPMDSRNVILGVGSNPRDVTMRKTVSNATDIANKGRLEESVFLQWVRDATELDRVINFRAKRALRVDKLLALSFMPGRITPSRATNADYDLLDFVRVRIVHGITNFLANMMIIGEQVVIVRGKEHVRVFLQDSL